MKKIWKIVLGIVIVLVVATVAVVVWQWDNISALYMGVTYSDEKIEKKIEDSRKKLAEQLEKENILDQKIIDGFSKEDEEKLAKGEITVEEAMNNLFGEGEQSDSQNGSETPGANAAGDSEKNTSKESVDNTSPQKTESKSEGKTDGQSNGTSSQNSGKSDKQQGKTGSSETSSSNRGTEYTQSQASSDKSSASSNQNQAVADQQSNSNASGNGEASSGQQLIKTAVQEMYALKAEFISKLGNIERTGKRMYIALGKEGMTTENKMKIADQLLPQLTAAEAECDAKVEAVLSKLSSGLNSIGADTSVVSTIREQYENEKKLQKSNMISEYL